MKWAVKTCCLVAGIAVVAGLYAARYSYIDGPRLSQLDPDSVVVVDYWTGGCDHNQHYLITFRDSIASNTRIELLRDAATVVEFDDDTKNIVAVSHGELAALDDYLRARRTQWFNGGWSTESRKMNITWFKNGRLFHSETYVDAMPYNYYDGRDAFTFEDLARPIRPSHVERFQKSTNQALQPSSGGRSILHNQSTPGTG